MDDIDFSRFYEEKNHINRKNHNTVICFGDRIGPLRPFTHGSADEYSN